jgi:type IV pilus assembly protein PilE
MNKRTSSNRGIGSPAKTGGFTLVELMIAVLVASILLSIAVPSYSSYVRKARRTEAKTAVLDLASMEERYFSTMNAYSSTPSDVGFASTAVYPVTVGNGYYNVSVTITTATATVPAAYTIVATALPPDQTKDTACYTFTVLSNGTQTATASGGADNTQTCWH